MVSSFQSINRRFWLSTISCCWWNCYCSASGTITSIAIGNSGSGYRTGIQTTGTNVNEVVVNVAIRTDSTSESNVVSIGTASVSGGHITGVAVTNSQVFYAPRDISNVGYSSITGLTTVTTSTAHGLTIDDEVIVSGIAFTCDYSGSGPVNVSNAVYDNISGIMTVTTSARSQSFHHGREE